MRPSATFDSSRCSRTKEKSLLLHAPLIDCGSGEKRVALPLHYLLASDPTMPTVQLKNSIRRLRFERNMTQEELALRTGVSRQTIMSIERGRTNPSVLLAYKIAAALTADVTEVFSMEGKLAPV